MGIVHVPMQTSRKEIFCSPDMPRGIPPIRKKKYSFPKKCDLAPAMCAPFSRFRGPVLSKFWENLAVSPGGCPQVPILNHSSGAWNPIGCDKMRKWRRTNEILIFSWSLMWMISLVNGFMIKTWEPMKYRDGISHFAHSPSPPSSA